MKSERLIYLLLLGVLVSCGQAPSGSTAPEKNPVARDTISTQRVRHLEPSLFTTDSVQVLFYDDPDGDSLRYTRYFTLTSTSDTVQVNSLLREMDQAYVQAPRTKDCRSEGKLYLLKGEDILKTVYFSARGDSCRYFYFIRDGAFYYFPLTEAAARWLAEGRRRARKP